MSSKPCAFCAGLIFRIGVFFVYCALYFRNTEEMTYLLLIAFVWGASKVISGLFDFFEYDLDIFYNYTGHEPRPLWQKFILKPTVYCNVCMSSFWGSICYWLLLQERSIPEWILHCVICAGAIWILNRVDESLYK